MWIGVFPELSGFGGIQQVGRQMGAAFAEAARQENISCELFGWNDPRGPGSFRLGPGDYSFSGFARDRSALLLRLLRSAPRIERLCLGHVNLAPLAWLLRRIRPRLRYWVALHGVEVWRPLPIFRRLALRDAEGLLSVSAHTAAQAAHSQAISPGKILVVPPALDPAFLEARCDCNVPGLPTGRLLLTVGRLLSSEPGKGADSVIRVLPDLLNAFPDLFYLIVGEGDLRPQLEALAREMRVADRVVFLGKLTLEQLKHCYSRCDAFVMPSRQEGFGLVFLEAMALGKPVIAAWAGGAPEVVTHGVTGFLVPPGDLESLRLHLACLLENDALRKRMGEAGRNRVVRDYTFEGYCRSLALTWNREE
jgi:glycosyltransferase involved in cell wall biosynthesis